MLVIEKLFLAYMIYSIIGWIMEVIVTIIEDKVLVNRGFLIGPYCPIYGVAFIFIELFLKKFMDEPIALFCLIVVLCTAIEYLTSLIMEKLFHARWWDYSHRMLNIDGRVCITNSIAFGILGMVALYFLNPVVEKFINSFSVSLTHILSIILIVILITDIVISFNIMARFKDKLKLISKDNTEEIKNKTNSLISNNVLMRRLKEAFPHYRPLIIKKIKSKIIKKKS